MRYYIFGLQRTGTNFLEALIKQNFVDSARITGTWKHSLGPVDHARLCSPVYVLYKNPFTWVESLCFRNSVDWVKTQKKYPARLHETGMMCGKNGFNVRSLALTYRDFYSYWLDNGYHEVRYEDLLGDGAGQFLSSINERRRHRNWRIPTRVSQSEPMKQETRDYYSSMKPTALTEEQITVIKTVIGDTLLSKMKYRID